MFSSLHILAQQSVVVLPISMTW